METSQDVSASSQSASGANYQEGPTNWAKVWDEYIADCAKPKRKNGGRKRKRASFTANCVEKMADTTHPQTTSANGKARNSLHNSAHNSEVALKSSSALHGANQTKQNGAKKKQRRHSHKKSSFINYRTKYYTASKAGKLSSLHFNEMMNLYKDLVENPTAGKLLELANGFAAGVENVILTLENAEDNCEQASAEPATISNEISETNWRHIWNLYIDFINEPMDGCFRKFYNKLSCNYKKKNRQLNRTKKSWGVNGKPAAKNKSKPGRSKYANTRSVKSNKVPAPTRNSFMRRQPKINTRNKPYYNNTYFSKNWVRLWNLYNDFIRKANSDSFNISGEKTTNADIQLRSLSNSIETPEDHLKSAEPLSQPPNLDYGHLQNLYMDFVHKGESSDVLISKDFQHKEFVAIDCEMVGILKKNQRSDMLTRVSIVNQQGEVLIDKFVKPRVPVTNRTKVSGVKPQDLENGEEFKVVKKEVAEILLGKILVGHEIDHDLAVLRLRHKFEDRRDTARCLPLQRLGRKNKTPAFKFLCKEVLGMNIQPGEHNSVEDARAVMSIYKKIADGWEEHLQERKHIRKMYQLD